MIRIVWMPGAADDFDAAQRWYAARNHVAADRFIDEVLRVLDSIAEAPGRWPVSRDGTRRVVVRRFPFKITYRWSTGDDALVLIAIAHGRRGENYQRGR